MFKRSEFLMKMSVVTTGQSWDPSYPKEAGWFEKMKGTIRRQLKSEDLPDNEVMMEITLNLIRNDSASTSIASRLEYHSLEEKAWEYYQDQTLPHR